MGRLIVLVLIVVLVLWLLRRAAGPRESRRDTSAGRSRSEASRDASGGQLVRCAHCGMYLPDAEAKRAAGLAYCTEDHARLGPRRS
jgi:uncharacterized protein